MPTKVTIAWHPSGVTSCQYCTSVSVGSGELQPLRGALAHSLQIRLMFWRLFSDHQKIGRECGYGRDEKESNTC